MKLRLMNAEVGLRPVGAIGAYAPEGMWPPASPSCRLYEPEAVGVIGACAPEGMRNSEFGMRKDRVATLNLF